MRKIAILCDFDGTVALDDVGNLLFRTFGQSDRTEAVIDLWKNGLISSRECLEREASLVKASRQQVDEFVFHRKLDPFFKDFFDFARRRGIEVVVVSDGLDYYIEKMLMRHGMGQIDVFANLLRLADHNFQVEFPYHDVRDCRDCGNCKTHHLEHYRKAGYFVIYVGNGLSDRCPSQYADLVFAKGELLDFCQRNGIECVEFRNFRDVEREVLKRFILNGDLDIGAEDADFA